MKPAAKAPAQIQYVVYDNQTGAILRTYSRLDAMRNEYVEVPIEELKKTFAQDATLIAQLTDGKSANLEVVRNDSPRLQSGRAAFMVDTKSRKIAPKPQLRITANKTQLEGDGADSAAIEVQAVNADGKPIRSLDDRIRITTERGKLSVRGGLTQLNQGNAKLELTAAHETVSRVVVRAQSLTGAAAAGELLFEFL